MTTISVPALALGIGANTAVFRVANAIVVTPPPWRATEDPAVPMMERVSGDPIFPGVSFVEFEEWQATARAFEGNGAHHVEWHAGFAIRWNIGRTKLQCEWAWVHVAPMLSA